MLTKVFFSGVAGSVVASYAGPKITPHLPDQLKSSPNMAKATNAVIAGGSAVFCYWALGKLGVDKAVGA